MNAASLSAPGMSTPGMSARLAFLLPALDEATIGLVAAQLEARVRLLVTRSWIALLRDCASALPAGSHETLHPPGSRLPDPDLLLGRLGHVITPALLLSLPLTDREAVTTALLAHPDAQTREHTLDALASGATTGGSPLHDACVAWSRRMLVAELGRIPTLSHMDRLRLQERLLAADDGSSGGPQARALDEPPPEARILGDALKTGANRRATTILAERAGVAPAIAEIAIALRDPRMLVSLCWKAGCDPAETLAVQLQLGHVAPGHILHAGPGGHWPLDGAAMQRQLAILEDI